MRLVFDLFKLRIGFAIAATALAGVAATPGGPLPAWNMAVLALAVLVASAAAGAFNQYIEHDLDARMGRTRNRAFVTGRLTPHAGWLWLIGALVAGATAAAAAATNGLAAAFVFLGAFFYGIVYTVWLKRRTWWNIVVGGLAGSFAVLAGSAAVSPEMSPAALALALVLFLWTPPHFWSLAIAFKEDYEQARVPMLPVVVGTSAAARVVLANTLVLVAASLVPVWFGLGPVYLVAALAGGTLLVVRSMQLARRPSRASAMANFHASLVQLSLLIVGAWFAA